MLRRMRIIAQREWSRLRSRRRLADLSTHELQAESAVTLDDHGEEIWSQRPDAPSQGASTVKVVSAWLATEHLDPHAAVTVVQGDSSLPPSKLRPGDSATVETLVRLSLISSDGHAAGALARAVGEQALLKDGIAAVPGAEARKKYRDIAEHALTSRGWADHVLADPVGADSRNRFTAREIASLFLQLRDEGSPVHSVAQKRAGVAMITRRRPTPVVLTNTYRPYTVAVPELIAGKTGWLFGPAYLVWSWKHPDGRIFTSALMGSDNDNRVADARKIIDASIAATT